MNRPIKFRGWNGKEMLYYNSWFTLHQQATLCFEKSEEHSYVDESDVDHPSRVELMQFTGLTDKNGKEIWEGDIVKWGGKFVIKVEDTGCGCHNGYGYPFDTNEAKELEVIGNIYENPELLNK